MAHIRVFTCFRGSPKEALESLPILSLRVGRTRNVFHSTNHSLYLIKMLSSNLEGKRWILPIFFAQSLNAPLLPVAIYSSYEARKNTLQTICSATFAPFTPHHTTPHPTPPHSTTNGTTQQKKQRHTRTRTCVCTCVCMCMCICMCTCM